MSKNTNNPLPWIVMACLLVILSFGHLLHDGSDGNAPAPRQEGFVRWVVRVVSEAFIHRAIREEPPATSLAEQSLFMQLPVLAPSDFLAGEGERLEHGEGW